jgi:hypothetical protein
MNTAWHDAKQKLGVVSQGAIAFSSTTLQN